MSGVGRGRGYTGRHNQPRPGDDAPRNGLEQSPRAAAEFREQEKKDVETEKELDREMERKERELEEDLAMMENLESISAEDDAVLKDLLYVDEEFGPLLSLLGQFSPTEDGIQFNRKLRNFESVITNMCPDEQRLHQAFATLRAAALLNPMTARKLAGVGASFTRQQRQILLRTALLNVIMQGTHAKLDILERANPMFLMNAANLMGDYFAEARLCNGNKVHILAAPLLDYLKALLASDDIRAHRSLATQLMQNGRELLSILPQETDELSLAIRLRVLTPPPCGIIWLFLSADMCLNRFMPLPNSLQQFYASHLKLTADDSYSEVSYGSWKKSPVDDPDSDPVDTNLSNLSLNHDDDTKPKLRPILGAGAGLLRQGQTGSNSQDSFETWNNQSKSSLAKRYDLNSWRQEEEKKEEPVYDPTVLPPNFTDYPPPTFNQNYQETFNNYLQQGDGTYIQNNYNYNHEFVPEGEHAETGVLDLDCVTEQTDLTFLPDQIEQTERVNSEVPKSSTRKPIENWRREKGELQEDSDKMGNWSRQHSRDNLDSEEEKEKRPVSRASRDSRSVNRMNRRDSEELSESGLLGKTPPKRHVSDVPRNNKYWDHDDRCDKDYNS